MDYADRTAVVTPEGLRIETPLAGLGSRFGAAVVDGSIQGGAFVVLAIVLPLTLQGAAVAEAVAVLTILGFLILMGYHIVFETLNHGRSPGKAAFGLRVVGPGGGAVSFWTSTVRNVLRLVDFLPVAYLTGAIVILATPSNRRLGDLAAGTLVVRVTTAPSAPSWDGLAPAGTRPDWSTGPPAAEDAWEVSAVTPDEVAAVRTFLSRRSSLPAEVRNRLAWEFAERLRPKVSGAPGDLHAEVFLEHLVREKIRRL